MNEVILKITGTVQGVFFRYHIKSIAEALNLKGFARNEEDGSVTIKAQGTKKDLEKLIEAAKKGSPRSKVENIKIAWSPLKEYFTEFSIL